ncbi:malto-oligosyltrehalose synthase [Janibacter sp. G1551]|uniref:malto-oligosyltrehalose synthase n=1 Tax=Janibacter sp. G1551 TaxID=3420440 RepID=UPI003D03649A
MTPTSTYRLQLEPRFTFADAARAVPRLAALGVTHLYLSPILQAAPGSTHGYDVVDHSRISDQLGGRAGLDALAATAHDHGLGLIVDVVPNHMAAPTPAHLNRQWWSLLKEGRESPVAHWFDVDWDSEDGRVLLPVLGAPLEDVLAAGDLVVTPDGGAAGDETVLRYHEHEFPIRPGTERLPIAELVRSQHHLLTHWRDGAERLTHRRFFDVTSLVAIRVEDPTVFDATHALFVDLLCAGVIDGLRIDHPDGLADPEGYLERLAEVTDGAWVVVEKILEGEERLPTTWPCAGTTGYDTLRDLSALFVDPDGAQPLTDVVAEITGESPVLADLVDAAKADIVAHGQAAEVARLVRVIARVLPQHSVAYLHAVLGALLVAMDRYRAYVRPGVPASGEAAAVLEAARSRAARALAASGDDLSGVLADTVEVLAGRAHGADATSAAEAVVRFQQTCGPVMAKGIEDTTFYRYLRLVGLNEVGGDPGRFGCSVADFHASAAQRHGTHPDTMTCLSTHDTKRSEDVRARLAVVSERPDAWRAWVSRVRDLATPHRPAGLDPATEYLIWQTIVGAGPLTRDRLDAYVTKAVREAKRHTTWTDPDGAYEGAVAAFVDEVSEDGAVHAALAEWLDETAEAVRATVLGQKLLQLVLPGVPDVYQGCEALDLSLVDPDNRRLVDHAALAARLESLDAGATPADLSDEKLRLTAAALRLRRAHPEWFIGAGSGHTPVLATTDHVVAVGRGAGSEPADVRVVAVVTRLASRLADRGGWGDDTLDLPPGVWRDVLSDNEFHVTGPTVVAAVLGAAPVALLVLQDPA